MWRFAGSFTRYHRRTIAEVCHGAKKKPLPRSLKLKSLAGGAPTCGNPLRFTMQQQQQTQWCWAAVSVSVNLFYHPASGQTQCAVANVAMGQTTCCQDGSTAQCNQPWFLDQALQIVANLNAWSPGKATLTKVKNQINNCRPLCLRIGWNGGGGHFVTMYGYSTQPNCASTSPTRGTATLSFRTRRSLRSIRAAVPGRTPTRPAASEEESCRSSRARTSGRGGRSGGERHRHSAGETRSRTE